MKPRVLLRVLPLAAVLTACGSEMPTAMDAPERAALDGGSLGPGHDTAPESTNTALGGSYGSGHDTAGDSLTTVARGGSLGPGH